MCASLRPSMASEIFGKGHQTRPPGLGGYSLEVLLLSWGGVGRRQIVCLHDDTSAVGVPWRVEPPKNLERQGWRDEALQGRIHGRFLGGSTRQGSSSQSRRLGPKQKRPTPKPKLNHQACERESR